MITISNNSVNSALKEECIMIFYKRSVDSFYYFIKSEIYKGGLKGVWNENEYGEWFSIKGSELIKLIDNIIFQLSTSYIFVNKEIDNCVKKWESEIKEKIRLIGVENMFTVNFK